MGKLHHDESQKTFELTEMQEFLSKDANSLDYRSYAKNIFNRIQIIFSTNKLNLLPNTKIEVRGQDKKKKSLCPCYFFITSRS